MSRYFNSGIQVPIVIFADPTGREIPGTRLGPAAAQVKATYLKNARAALDAFRGGLSPEKAREQWAGFGRALADRKAGDVGACVEALARIRDGAAKDGPLRVSVEEFLKRLNDEEAAGFLELGKSDLASGEADSGLDSLFTVVRDFPGLPAAGDAARALEKAKADPAKADAWKQAERRSKGKEALRAADRLARAGKKDEARAAYEAVAKEYDGTPAGLEAKEKAAKKDG